MTTFADTTDVQLRVLAGTLGVVYVNLTREAMMVNLTAHNALIGEDRELRSLPAQMLKDWAHSLGLANYGIRSAIVARIHVMADPPPVLPPAPQVYALDNPRDIFIRKLENLTDMNEFKAWVSDIQLKAEARDCWIGCLQVLYKGEDAQANAIRPNVKQAQTLLLLLSGIKNSIGKSIRDQITPLIDDAQIPNTAAAIMKWVTAQMTHLGSALERKAIAKLNNAKWKDSKMDLMAWVGQLRSIAAECGPNVPIGRVREERIRQLVFKNVGEREPSCGQIIREHKQHEVEEDGYSVDFLVRQLMKIMVEAETSGERQCSTFSVETSTETELHAMLAAEKKKTQKTKQENNTNAKNNGDQGGDSFYGGGKGWNNSKGYKGGYKGNFNNNNTYGASTTTTTSNMFCHKCNKHYKDKGMLDEKYNAIRSHYTNDCRWKNNTNSQSNANPNAVKKDNEKQRKGDKGKDNGAKGKGKKGGKKGKKGK